MNKYSTIYVAGHTGLVGSAILRKLKSLGYVNIITRTHKQLDLTNQSKVHRFFKSYKPEYVFMCAGLVGGIIANNSNKAEFLYQNALISLNVIHEANIYSKKILYLGSSCIYPGNITDEIYENMLLTGTLESTNEGYSLSKILSMKYSEYLNNNCITCMPTNMYGYNDNYNLETAHVLPALIRKFYEATKNNDVFVKLGGNGLALRTFMFADDFADICIGLMDKYNDTSETINISPDDEISIADLATKIKDISGFKGIIINDSSIPTGTQRKKLNTDKMKKLNLAVHTTLDEGLKKVYKDFSDNYDKYTK